MGIQNQPGLAPRGLYRTVAKPPTDSKRAGPCGTSENAILAKFAVFTFYEVGRISHRGISKRLHSLAMDRVLSLIEHYGYLVIFLGVMLESTGVPLPGETILLASGVLVQRGHLNLGDVIAFGILGAVLGDQIGYWVGRGGGRPFVLRWGRYVFITPARLGRAEAFFERHGGKAVFLARFFSGLRVFGALVAGTSRMRWGKFTLYNLLGGTVWASAVVVLGYFLWASISQVEHWVGRASLLLLAVLAFALLLRWAYRRVTRG
jgi:membrane protein DedA with SNARE-associated domain